MAPLLLLLALVLGSAEQIPCQEYRGPSNKTCVLKADLYKTLNYDEDPLLLEWDGDLIVPAKQRQSLTTKHHAVLSITGTISFQEDSSFFSIKDLRISARGFRFSKGSSVQSYNLTLSHETCDQGMIAEDAELQSYHDLILSCPFGTVNFTGSAMVLYTPSVTTYRISIAGKNVYLEDSQTQFKSLTIQLVAMEELRLKAEPTTKCRLLVQGNKVVLGWKGGSWIVHQMTVLGGSLVQFAPDHRIEVTYTTSCNNRDLLSRDPCEDFLDAPRQLPSSLDGHSVDFAVLAEGFIDIGPRVRLVGASPFICAGSTVLIQKEAVISSDGRGCRAGKGRNRGETRPFWMMCGAAGGSNFGEGGSGAKLMKSGLTSCAKPGHSARSDFSDAQLPLTGGAGGGCAVPEGECIGTLGLLTSPISAGGGAVWLSATAIVLREGVRISASGLNGGMVVWGTFNLAAGGGAGGQIIALSSRFEFQCEDALGLDCKAPKLIAKGGDAQCISKSVSVGGAGGGGFIGLRRNSTSSEEIELDVSGGALTTSCADALPQKGRDLIEGEDGSAISLVPCQEGHAGPFCSPCPVGSWGDGENPCVACSNKEGSAFYSSDAWPNSSCLYECEAGLPDVKINPNCINNIDFAMSCFGGRMGFATTLACPLMAFILARGIHWLHRRRRRQPGNRDRRRHLGAGALGHFQVERLPQHVCRIYWQGSNSNDSPWQLSDADAWLHALPPAVRMAADRHAWEQLVVDLRKAVLVPCWEPWCLFVVWLICVPLYELLSIFFRKCRAKRAAKRCASNRALWGTAPREGAHHELCFGCDDAATLGHLDVFDLSRSLVDWAPAGGEQLFVAQGVGSWKDPFELNVADPLLLGLAQTPEPMAAQAIYSLVCTFNLFSRLVPGSELSTAGDGGHLPALSLLDHEVRHCSVRVGQTAQVQVLRSVAPAPRTAGGATEHRGSEDRRSTARLSFTELVRRIPGAEEQSVAVTTTGHVDWKLCLVFPHVNAGYSNELVRHVQGVLVAPEAGGNSAGCLDFSDGSAAASSSLLKQHRGGHGSLGELLRSKADHLRFQMLSPWVCSIQSPILAFLVSVLFLTLILLDGMVCALVGYSLWNLCGRQAFCLWLLLPTPFAPVLSTAVGVASVLLHRPSRMHSQLAWRSCFNVSLVGLPLLLKGHAKAQLLPWMSLILNLATCYAAAVYANLEAFARDLASAEDSGNASLRGQLQREPTTERSRQEKSEIAMTVLQPANVRTPSSHKLDLRSRLSTFESEAESVTPMSPF